MGEKFNLIFKVSITLLISVIALISISNFEGDIRQESISLMEVEDLEKVLNEALISCYAVEGAYPSSIKYLKHYGMVFDDEKYIYEYDAVNSYELPKLKVTLR